MAAIRFVSEYESGGNYAIIRRFHGYASKISIRNGVVLGALVAVVGVVTANSSSVVFWIAAMLLVPLIAFANVSGGIIHGLGRVVESQATQQVLRPAVVLACVVSLFAVSGEQLRPLDVYISQVFAAMGVGIVLLTRLRTLVPAGRGAAEDAVGFDRTWRAVSWPLLLISGSNMIIAQCDIAMLGVLSTATQAALYAVASKAAALSVLGITAVDAVVAPLLAKFHAEGQTEKLQQTLSQAAAGIFATTLLLAGFAFLFSEILLGLFGKEYVSGNFALRTLVSANVFNASVGPAGYLLIMTGNQKAAAVILSSIAILNVILNGALIPLYGAHGAACATAISIVVWNIIMYAFCRIQLQLDPSVLSWIRRRV